MVALSLTLAQVDLITEDAFIGEHLLAILYAAKVYDNIVRVLCTLDDLDQLSKHVADVANKTTDKKHQQKLIPYSKKSGHWSSLMVGYH